MQNLAIFGAGLLGKRMKRLVEDKYSNQYRLTYFIDNDPAKQGSLIDNTPIISTEKLLQIYGKEIDLVTPAFNKSFVIIKFLLQKEITVIHIQSNGVYPVNSMNIVPRKIVLDASTLCQLNCKTCYMRKYNSGTVGKGYLKFSDFEKFIINNKFLEEISLSNNGEPLLNPDLIRILENAYENNITLRLGSTNFNTASDEILEGLVKYQCKSLTASIDGACQEVYSKYRINGNFNTVIENIEKLNDLKKKYNSQFPELTWKYIIMEHNENDIIKAKTMAKQLNMGFVYTLTWDPGYVPKNMNMLKETGLQFFSREEVLNKTKIEMGLPCWQLYEYPHINYDGRLLGCCRTFADDFGVNVFDVGLEKAFDNENYKLAKAMLMGETGISENVKHIPCANCASYKRMVETGIYLPAIFSTITP